jgi:hypothetical protein
MPTIDGTLMGHLRPTSPNKRHMTLDLVGFALWGFESPLSHQSNSGRLVASLDEPP